MSGKKTAVFGIYSTLSSADHATDTLVRSGFAPSDISAHSRKILGPGKLELKKPPRRRKARRREQVPARSSAARWACSLESERWPFRASARSSLLDRSWPHWPASVSAAPSADSPAH